MNDNGNVVPDGGEKKVTNTKNSGFTPLAKAFFIGVHFTAVLILSTTENNPFYSLMDNASICRQNIIFFLLSTNRIYQFNYQDSKYVCQPNDMMYLSRNDCWNAKLHFMQVTFSLLSTSPMLKLTKKIALTAKDFGFVDFMTV